MPNKKVLILGAGVAGPTLAYWLLEAGFDATIIEKAPELRKGGYIVDFWGSGYEVADRMGIIPRLKEEGYDLDGAWELDSNGKKIAFLSAKSVFKLTGGRHLNIGRTELSAAAFDLVKDRVEVIFGQSLKQIKDTGEKVQVQLTDGSNREFDLVIGADGLHSRVRLLHFGSEGLFERDSGMVVAAFDAKGYQPRDDSAAVGHTEIGGYVLRLSQRDDYTMFVFMVRAPGEVPIHNREAQEELLRNLLTDFGWETKKILELMPNARTFYFDKASQIRMPSWSKGRVCLIGDAAACPSLLAGQGTALAMVEAYLLAYELKRNTDHSVAFQAFEKRLAGIVLKKQDAALGLATVFAPKSQFQLWLKKSVFKIMGLPGVARIAIGASLRDPIELPRFTD
mgnify:CR=1 FL=1